jgi:hypothetical protein
MKKRVVSATGSAAGKATCDGVGGARASGTGSATGSASVTGVRDISVRGFDAVETVRREARADALRENSSRGGKSERKMAKEVRDKVLSLEKEVKATTRGSEEDIAAEIRVRLPRGMRRGSSQILKIMRSARRASKAD